MKYEYKSVTLEDTNHLAHLIAKFIQPNFVVSLNGDLGAGKTTLTREILRSLGVVGSVKSPTFTLVEPYSVQNFTIYHFDLYRFNDPDEWFDAGFDEYFSPDCICFIEWASRAHKLIPKLDWVVNIEMQTDLSRIINIESQTLMGDECLKKLISNEEA